MPEYFGVGARSRLIFAALFKGRRRFFVVGSVHCSVPFARLTAASLQHQPFPGTSEPHSIHNKTYFQSMSAKRYKVLTFQAGEAAACSSSPSTTPPTAVAATTNTSTNSNNINSSTPSNPLANLTEKERDSIILFTNSVDFQVHRQGGRTALSAVYELLATTSGLYLAAAEDEWQNDKERFLYKFLYATTALAFFRVVQEQTRWWIAKCPDIQLHTVRMALLDTTTPLPTTDEAPLKQAVQSLRRKRKSIDHSQSTGDQSTEQPTAGTTVNAQSTTDSTTNNSSTESHPVLISPPTPKGATVEDRVKAKAEARVQREQQEENNRNTTTADDAWRLRLADILWSHARQVWHRHDQFARNNNNNNNNTSPCSFVLQDVVKLLTEQSAAAGTKVKRQQVLEWLRTVCDRVPTWLRRTAAQPDRDGWQPSDTLWLYPVDYQEVRARLLGKAVPVTNGSIRASGERKVESDLDKVVDAKDGAKVEIKQATKPTINSSLNFKKRPLAALLSVVKGEKTKKGELVAPKTTQNEPEEQPSTPKKMRLGPRLRINPNLILTDADHQGGERIFPSRHDSPRGLRNLFLQMNSGKRI